jgi:hypothetical protein|tara:strand:+ start:856 stop:1473 length:618 start_codon:yes stop_codon:yes gene_type:complete
MNRDDVVDSALDKINGDRQDEYGDVLNSFTTISIGWDTIVKSALGTHGCITPMHVGLMMDWLKTSRLLVDINHRDSWVDKVGYAALSAEVADRYMEPGELLDIRWGTGRVSPDVPPEGVVVEVEIDEEPPVWDGTIQDVETKKWINDPYEPKTCQKIDGRNGKPCGRPLVGRQRKFCSKHVPKSTKAARKAYGKRSKRQVNYQLS